MTESAVHFQIFPWNENFATGIPSIDEQHYKLVEILNRLARQFADGVFSGEELNKIVDELADYAHYHFSSEEEIWHRHFEGHPMLVQHEKAHHDFFERIK
ncbi:MAG: bacteriohemerythrin [Pseudomonadota bacterium]